MSLVMEHCTAGDLFKTMLVHGGVLDEHWVCIQVWILQIFFEVLQQSHTFRNGLKVGRARPDDGGGLHQTLRRWRPQKIYCSCPWRRQVLVGSTPKNESAFLFSLPQVIAPLLRVQVRLHEAHILHRDIKPENLFLTRTRQLKLGDLGLAIVASEELPFTRSGAD